jgi:hypothetical protein
MKEYRLVVEKLYSIVRSEVYKVKASSIEEAIQKCIEDDVEDDNFQCIDSNILYDTMEELIPENKSNSIIGIYDDNTNEKLK